MYVFLSKGMPAFHSVSTQDALFHVATVPFTSHVGILSHNIVLLLSGSAGNVTSGQRLLNTLIEEAR